jgi:hypothetical protein
MAQKQLRSLMDFIDRLLNYLKDYFQPSHNVAFEYMWVEALIDGQDAPSDSLFTPSGHIFSSCLPRNLTDASVGPECCLRIHGTTCGMWGSPQSPPKSQSLGFGSVAIDSREIFWRMDARRMFAHLIHESASCPLHVSHMNPVESASTIIFLGPWWRLSIIPQIQGSSTITLLPIVSHRRLSRNFQVGSERLLDPNFVYVALLSSRAACDASMISI